ncbi:unnamed protein product [Notodromas monacha]|uniref:KAT8 regulatory NSL complex subunit 2 n=1 Tax=Notodromas monacha TaxID=399045 RepID=A0A7R9BEV3_9CRUS|nr:unnamed protein product [Notodromas monacha]CAG0913528.1 unnamed protein product [Notodromas monacha]
MQATLQKCGKDSVKNLERRRLRESNALNFTDSSRRSRKAGEMTELCSHYNFPCENPRYPGSTHCIEHILEDLQNTSFMQCSYVHKNGKRCFGTCPVSRKEGLCDDHLMEYERLKKLADRDVSVPSTRLDEKDEALFRAYADFKRDLGMDQTGAALSATRDDPFMFGSDDDVDDEDEELEAYSSGIFGRCDRESLTIGMSRRDDADDDCPYFAESSCHLENAGTLTEEEVLTIASEKMLRLRELYQKEQDLIKRSLAEKRKKYLTTARREVELYGTVVPSRESVRDEGNSYTKFKWLRRLSRFRGPEAVLLAKSVRSAARKEGNSPKCVYAPQRGTKCGEKPICGAKYCLKHILSDPYQVLFRPCDFQVPDAEGRCQEPVFPLSTGLTLFCLEENETLHCVMD